MTSWPQGTANVRHAASSVKDAWKAWNEPATRRARERTSPPRPPNVSDGRTYQPASAGPGAKRRPARTGRRSGCLRRGSDVGWFAGVAGDEAAVVVGHDGV